MHYRRFREDLFKGTSEYYDRFRPEYPLELIEDLRTRVPLDKTSRLLDLACGTGQIMFALAASVGEIWAVDQEAEAIEFGKKKAERLSVANVRWIASSAENVELVGLFDLVAIGNAFHRLDRDVVVRRLLSHLSRRGCVALLWSWLPWRGDRPWQSVMSQVLDRWRHDTGADDRTPAGWQDAMSRDPHDQVLQRAGLLYEGKCQYSVVVRWSVESLIGFVYSTSFLNRSVLKQQAGTFEADLRERLLHCQPDGDFHQDQSFAYELARRGD